LISYLPFGCHFGLEVTELADMARLNLKVLTVKGMMNFLDGRFTEAGMKESGGAVMHVKPPHVLVGKGDFQELKHLCGMDVVYSFDKVNGFETKYAVSRILNHRLSENVKIFVTNLTEGEMDKNGYKGWTIVCQYTAKFNGSKNTREFYFSDEF
jgi:hypothetical protein